MKKYRRPKPSDIQVAVMACWCYDHPKCWRCGLTASTHHMVSGQNRWKAEHDPRCCLRLCQQCHQGKHGAHDYGTWPIARQLALKFQHDRQHYNRKLINKLRGRAPNAISKDDVRKWLKPKGVSR